MTVASEQCLGMALMRLYGLLSSRGGRVSREVASPLSAMLFPLLKKSAYHFSYYGDKNAAVIPFLYTFNKKALSLLIL
jgi:hypothetical protein